MPARRSLASLDAYTVDFALDGPGSLDPGGSVSTLDGQACTGYAAPDPYPAAGGEATVLAALDDGVGAVSGSAQIALQPTSGAAVWSGTLEVHEACTITTIGESGHQCDGASVQCDPRVDEDGVNVTVALQLARDDAGTFTATVQSLAEDHLFELTFCDHLFSHEDGTSTGVVDQALVSDEGDGLVVTIFTEDDIHTDGGDVDICTPRNHTDTSAQQQLRLALVADPPGAPVPTRFVLADPQPDIDSCVDVDNPKDSAVDTYEGGVTLTGALTRP